MAEVAVVTGNMRLYYKIIQELRDEGIPFISVKPGETIPSDIKCVITSDVEKNTMDHPKVLTVETKETSTIVPKLRFLLNMNNDPISLVTIGVDPGKTYGLAVLVNDNLVDVYKAFSSKGAAKIIRNVLETFSAVRKIIRIGTGAPLYYKPLLELLRGVDAELELVDEFETSSGPRVTKDTKAALAIAKKEGCRPQEFEKLQEIKKGTIKHIQKMSRQASHGRITINEANALKVARGEISLDFAIASQKKKGMRKDS